MAETNRKADTWFYGMGFWTRQTRKCACWLPAATPNGRAPESTNLSFPISSSTAKNRILWDKIVKLMGDQPRVELFARQKTPGWDVWGNEVDCTITLPAGKEEI